MAVRIAFRLPDLTAPSGGLSFAYRCARYLAEDGHDVVLAHDRAGHRYPYEDAGEARVEAVRAVRRRGVDVVVLPEILAGAPDLTAPITVVLNQNPFLTGGRASDELYRHAEVIATSEYTARYLTARYPAARIHRVTVGVDLTLFGPVASGPRTELVYLPRKRAADAELVLAALDRPVAALDGVPPAALAHRLGGAAMFLAFGEREGLGLPVAEAMACGTPCVGFTGVGGAELLTTDTGWPVPEGDVLAYIDTVRSLLTRLADPAGDPQTARRTSAAQELVATRYTRRHERESVRSAFAALLPPDCSPT